MKNLVAAGLLGLLAGPAGAAPLCDDFGFAGLLAACNRAEEPIRLNLASGVPLGEDQVLQSGAYYELEIVADGSAELAIEGPSFFRAIWMNEIVINKIEIRPMAIDSIEFDKAGVVELSFIAIKPGNHVISIPGARGETQQVTISIQ